MTDERTDAPTEMADLLDAIDESREEVESSLEDLLIFPNGEGLRRAMEGLASHFALEGEVMRSGRGCTTAGSSLSFPERDRDWAVEEQDRIMGIASGELNRRRRAPPSSTPSTSCGSGNSN
jgi:hypothetical protein